MAGTEKKKDKREGRKRKRTKGKDRKKMDIKGRDWNVTPGDSPQLAFYVRKMLERYREEKGVCFLLEPGKYHFYPDYAYEKMLCIPNHEEDTVKRIVFDLSGYEKLHIKGEGAEFIFHGDCIPFYLCGCKEVVLEGLQVDYERPGYSQGIIQKVEERRMEIAVDREQFPYYVKGGRVYFCGESDCRELERWLEMDKETKAPAKGLGDREFNLKDGGVNAVYRETAYGMLEISIPDGEEGFSAASHPGNALILRHHPRNCPAFYMENSQNVTLRQVKIFHALAMGVIGWRSENISLEEVAVKRREEKGHIFTTEADAFHFVCCRGWILVKGCLCENQLDDALNVHGIYGRVKQVEEDGSFLLELAHGQQKGVELLRAGETFRCLETEHMESFAEGKVKRAERLNKDYIEVFPQEAVPGLKAGHVVENLDWRPKVTVEGCVFRNNRARGLLCTGIGQAWIKGNTFQTPGAGILIEGDANEWFESGSAQHIVIEDNLFDGCAYIRGWGKAPIQITPRVASPLEGKHFHKKIEIKGNVFRRAHPQALRAYQVGELVWKGNRIEDKEDYQDTGEPVFCVEHVGVWEKDGMEGRQESLRHTQG